MQLVRSQGWDVVLSLSSQAFSFPPQTRAFQAAASLLGTISAESWDLPQPRASGRRSDPGLGCCFQTLSIWVLPAG